MDNFDLRKFLAENRQQEQSLVSELVPDPHAQGGDHYGMPADFKPPGAKEGADEAMEEIVAEYVTEALGCTDMKEVASIIERRCNEAAMKMKMETIAEVLAAYEGRLAEIKGSQYFKEMADEAKVAAQEGMIQELHQMAEAIKAEYKETYMPEEKVEEGDESVEEGKTIDGSTIKIVDGPIGAPKFTNALKAQKNLPTPPPLPPNVVDAVKAYLNDPKSSFKDFGTGNDSTATKASKAFSSYVLNNKKLADADKGYYINQFNTMVMGKKKSKPAPPPLPSK